MRVGWVSLAGSQPPEKLAKSFMSKYHYVYKSFEQGGREYIGRRTCDCLPEEDTKYFGSFTDKTFKPTEKTILFVCETRKEAAEIEIELHDFFDVAVNPRFANKAKATSTKFDVTGVPNTEEAKRKKSVSKLGEKNPMFGMYGENHPLYGVPHTEEWKQAHSERMSGEKNPQYGRTSKKSPNYGVPKTKGQKRKMSEATSGEKHPRSKATIAIKPDGTQLHFSSGREAARKLGIPQGSLSYLLNNGHVLTRGPFKDWQFRYGNPYGVL